MLCASSSSTDNPASASSSASVTPVMPPPTMATSASASASSGANGSCVAVPSQIGSIAGRREPGIGEDSSPPQRQAACPFRLLAEQALDDAFDALDDTG